MSKDDIFKKVGSSPGVKSETVQGLIKELSEPTEEMIKITLRLPRKLRNKYIAALTMNSMKAQQHLYKAAFDYVCENWDKIKEM